MNIYYILAACLGVAALAVIGGLFLLERAAKAGDVDGEQFEPEPIQDSMRGTL